MTPANSATASLGTFNINDLSPEMRVLVLKDLSWPWQQHTDIESSLGKAKAAMHDLEASVVCIMSATGDGDTAKIKDSQQLLLADVTSLRSALDDLLKFSGISASM